MGGKWKLHYNNRPAQAGLLFLYIPVYVGVYTLTLGKSINM